MTAWIGSRGGNEGGNSRMNCQVHFEREARSFCKECNAPMCPECNSTFGSMCMRCVEKLCQDGKKEIIITFGISLVCLIFGYWFMLSGDGLEYNLFEMFLTGFFFFFLPFGWKAVGKIADYVFLIFTRFGVMGWIFFFLLKLVAALLIGWILGIPKMVQMIKDWKTYHTFGTRVKEMKMVPKNRVVNE